MRSINTENLLFPFGQGARKLALAAAFAVCVSLPSFAQQADRSDASIEADIVNTLNASPALKDQQITAATIEGDVTLSGTVKDAASKELAEMAVSRVAGVRSVQNHLSVGDGSQQEPAYGQGSDQGTAPMPQEQAPMPTDQAAPQQTAPVAPSARPVYSGPESSPTPRAAVVIPQGTLLRARTSELLDGKHLEPGTMVEFTAASDIVAGGALAIPRGAVLEGQVVDVKVPSGSVTGKPAISLKLNTLILEGRTYVLNSDVWTAEGSGKGGYTASNTAAGAALGAVIGAIAGGGPGAAIGAVAGGATGVAASAATSGPRLVLPAETPVNFHLAQEVTVVPVSQQEAQRLATAQGGNRPSLHSREAYAYPPPPMVYPYPYPYYYYGYPYPYVYYGVGGRWHR